MKVGTVDLIKFKRLQRSLSESQRGIVGLLELLWAGTAKNCPQGDIGRFENIDIAVICDWEGDPDKLIDALVDCGWLDKSEDHRLVVHDWHEHCPTWVKGNLASSKKPFASVPESESDVAKQVSEEDAKEGAKDGAKGVAKEGAKGGAKPPTTKPNQAKPYQAQPHQAAHGWFGCSVVGGECTCEAKAEKAVEIANKLVRLSDRKRLKYDRELFWRYSWIAANCDPGGFLDACDRILEHSVDKPSSYLATVVRKMLEFHGVSINQVTLELCPPIPPPTNEQRNVRIDPAAISVC
jgi:hypothetical protein